MAWRIRDEWIDAAKGEHVVIFENPDILVEVSGSVLLRREPITHALTNFTKMPACPHCGRPTGEPNGHDVDFETEKSDTLKGLHNHHRASMAYQEIHKGVRMATGPKK
jgi:hypothetical protein